MGGEKMKNIELTIEEFYELLKNNEIPLFFANRTIHIFKTDNKTEMLMNYEGYGYKAVKISIDFEYDEKIKFTESED